jgi:hypothetical protein
MGLKQTFVVWCPENGETEADGGVNVHAACASDAAEQWASQHDSDTIQPIAGQGESREVCVRRPDGELLAFAITGEYVPTYYVRAIEPEEIVGETAALPVAGAR